MYLSTGYTIWIIIELSCNNKSRQTDKKREIQSSESPHKDLAVTNLS